MLVRLLQDAEQKGQITGLKVARTAPLVSHLLFADDSMFYCQHKDEELNKIVSIIEEYSLASGQRVNYQKSSIYFGKQIPQERRDAVKNKLGISQEGGEGFYLGLPESFGGSKVGTLTYLKERIQSKVYGWLNNFLSSGGKETLLKAVAMALPTYPMSCFLLPKATHKQIASVFADFWWRNKKDSRGMHWKSWDQLTKPKAEGGIGFRDIEDFNIALLGKQLWRMLSRPKSLMARVYKARYFSKSNPLTAPLGSRPSYAWRSIHAAQELLNQGARVIVGDGSSINIWKHKWLGSKPAVCVKKTIPISPRYHHLVSALSTVKDLLDGNGKEWRQDLVDLIFHPEDRRLIEQIRPGGNCTSDTYAWDYTKSGDYTVKSGYWVYTQILKKNTSSMELTQPNLNPIYEKVWSSKASPKVQHFLWKCLSNCLSVAGNLAHIHIARDAHCIRCPGSAETVNHLLFQCTVSRLIWAVSPIPAPPGGEWSDSICSNLFWVLNLDKECPQLGNRVNLVPWLLWRLWKNRNNLCFKGSEYTATEVISKALEDLEEWEKREELKDLVDNLQPMCHLGAKKRTNVIERWRPPPLSWVTCNTNASWHEDAQRCGIGWILRNDKGDMIWSGARAIPKVRSVLEAELQAMRWAVSFLTSLRYDKVIFESDSQVLINILCSREDWPSILPGLQDIRRGLSLFHEVRLVFRYRGSNMAADRIARESLSFQNYDPKLYSIAPNWLKNIVDLEK